MKDSARFSGQTVLVTGASGFIGSHLLNRLARSGAEVHAVSRALRPATSNGACWHQGDLADASTVRNLLSSLKPDVIFHLAGHVAGSRHTGLVMPTFQCSLMTTVNLLTAATEVGCARLILSGSQEEPSPGSPEAVPCSPYAMTKWASSAYARMFHALYRFPVVILRVFMVYGPAQRDVRKLIPYVILSLLRGETPKLMSGERQVDWIYVDDVVDGLLASAHASHVEGKTIDIGTGELMTVRSLVGRLVRLMDSGITPVFGAVADRPLEQVRVADTKPAEEFLRWTPRVPLDEGLKRTISWYDQARTEQNPLLGETVPLDCDGSGSRSTR